MIFWLASGNLIIWHIVGIFLYEIIIIPLLYIMQYLFLIFVMIITTNIGPKVFYVTLNNNQIYDNFGSSPLFYLYLSCFGISIFIFVFGLLFNLLKDFIGKDSKLSFYENIKWFAITLLIYPLLPIFFSLLLLLTSICFNILGFHNKLHFLTQNDISNFNENFNLYKTQILNYWNNSTLNQLLEKAISTKANTNSFYYENLVDNINNYENLLINNENIFNQIQNIFSQLVPNISNSKYEAAISSYVTQLNEINNYLININTDLKNLNLSELSTLKQFVTSNSSYFNGTIINDLLFSLPYSLNNISSQLTLTYNFNLIKIIEEMCNNNTGIITATPNFYSLNWNVVIAIIFCLCSLIILFLYSILEIRRIVELIVLFLIAPFSFLIVSRDKNYYFSKWFKLTLQKFFSFLLIAIIFETAITIYPYINNAIESQFSNSVFKDLIISAVVGIGVLLASFFSINTILAVFDARENFMEIIGDLYSLKLATKSIPIISGAFRRFKNKNTYNLSNYANEKKNLDYELSTEDILFQKIPVRTVGFEGFMSSDSTKNSIQKTNSALQKVLFGSFANKSISFTNKKIEKSINKHFKKYHMEEQKWKKTREEGEF